MKSGYQAGCQFKIAIASIAVAALLTGAGGLRAQEDSGGLLEVSKAAICTGIVDHEPVDQSVRYPATVGKVYCFSKISNIESATSIQHVWYFDNSERARVKLPVKPPSWRTYSSKRIMPEQTGRWRVDVLDCDGNVLKTLGFDIMP